MEPPTAEAVLLADAAPPSTRQGLPARVAASVLQQYARLPKTGKPQAHEFTVLAGFVLQPPGPAPLAVLALATGTKCLGGGRRCAGGSLLADSHAEVLARRALLRWLADEAAALLAGKPSRALELCAGEGCGTRLRLRRGAALHMYVSYPPCGDACVLDGGSGEAALVASGAASGGGDAGEGAGDAVSKDVVVCSVAQATSSGGGDVADVGVGGAKCAAADAGRGGAAVLRTGAKRLKVPGGSCKGDGAGDGGLSGTGRANGGSGTVWAVPQACDVEACPAPGLLRRKPGRGGATLSMSCSDKLARWGCLGLQGALWSSVLAEPLYLDAIVAALPAQLQGANAAAAMQHALLRAVWGRVASAGGVLQQPFAARCPVVAVVQAGHQVQQLGLALAAGPRRSAASTCINWSACASHAWRDQEEGVRMPQDACRVEVTLGASGRRAGGTKAAAAAAQSSLSGAAARVRFFGLLCAHPHPQLLGDAACREKLQQLGSAQLKAAVAPCYCRQWSVLREPGRPFEGWISKS